VPSLPDYCRQRFDATRLPRPPVLPRPDEPQLEDWRRYAADVADSATAFQYLQQRLPQLRIPIREGISTTHAYAAAARRGEAFDEAAFGGVLTLESPERFAFLIHPHPAGALPVLCPATRSDFETLVRALGCRNEPAPVHPSVNAQMVSGFVNWDRVARLRDRWPGAPDAWGAELQRVATEEPARIRDRFIVVMAAPYSGVAADRLGLGLDPAAWIERSTAIRIEHEFTHYATKRLFGEMRVHAFDELVADCLGFTHAFGTYRAQWGLGCLGIAKGPVLAPGGRLHAYRDGLDDQAFRELCGVVARAAGALEDVCSRYYEAAARGRFLLAATLLTLDDLAAADSQDRFAGAWERAGALTAAGSTPASSGS
jgi:hypothetical protein